MASKNKTDFLKLNQWVESDPVLRADFNNDNLKIDEAVGDLRQEAQAGIAEANTAIAETNAAVAAAVTKAESENMWVKLMDITIPATTQQVDLDLSGIDFTQYTVLKIYPEMTHTYSSPHISLRCNGLTGSVYASTSEGSNSSSASSSYMTLYASNTKYRTMTEISLYCGSEAIFIHGLSFAIANTGSTSSTYYSSSDAGGPVWGTLPLTELETLNFVTASNATFTGTARFMVYAMKI